MCLGETKIETWDQDASVLEVWTSPGARQLWVLWVQPKASRTWFKLYYFNPTQASINDIYCIGYYAQSCWTDPDTSVVSPPMAELASHHVSHEFYAFKSKSCYIGLYSNVIEPTQVLFMCHGLYIFSIDQGQGRGLGSSDRTLTGAGKNHP